MAQSSILRYLASRSSPTKDGDCNGSTGTRLTTQPVILENFELPDVPRASTAIGLDVSRASATATRDEEHGIELSCVPGTVIARVGPSHVDAIKRLTSTTLPMRYPEKFYTETIQREDVGDLARVVLFEGQPVGWIRCLIHHNPQLAILDGAATQQIYIQVLCLLAPYRQRGLATQLLGAITSRENLHKYSPTSIYAHVWENNEDALQWYERRGFKRVLLVDQYYRRLRPSGAWIMRKELG